MMAINRDDETLESLLLEGYDILNQLGEASSRLARAAEAGQAWVQHVLTDPKEVGDGEEDD